MKQSRFDKWFTGKFGKRPSRLKDERRLFESVQQGEANAELLRASRRWDAMRNAALKGWTAK